MAQVREGRGALFFDFVGCLPPGPVMGQVSQGEGVLEIGGVSGRIIGIILKGKSW